MKIALTAAELFTPLERVIDPVVSMEDGVITAVGPRIAISIPTGARHLDFPGAVLAPGFIDLHIHGSAGHDVMEAEASSLANMENFIVRHGVTSYCPTTVTAPLDKTLSALERLGKAIKQNQPAAGRARPIGLHLEGPFISTAKCGVHPVNDILPPSVEIFEKFWQASGGSIRVVTLAPELPGAEELVRVIIRHGACASLGHSDAETVPARTAVDAGARHVTHTFNAMRKFDHREPGILGVALSDVRLSADIIADGVHVADEALRMFLASKGEAKVSLITDAISATGMPDGTYTLGTFKVEVKGNTCMHNGRLAGSVLTMDLAIRNIMRITQWDLQRSIRLATLNPAETLGVADRKGRLQTGFDADIVVLTPQGNVVRTITGGMAE